ncbi:MAG: CinA family nicotinamide mononucleotide deamidase-related protein [Vicinamibacterales bacterium]
MTRPQPRAALLAIGSELLALGRADTNSPYIAAVLQRVGVEVVFTQVVGDDADELAAAMRQALARADLVVCTGGLGPTDDDRTRPVAARLLGLPLHEDGALVDAMRARFAARQLAMPEINRRQAMVPDGATVLANGRGTAPGLWLPTPTGAMLLLPGPPREMQPMLEDALTRCLAPRFGLTPGQRRVVVVAGRSESWVDERLAPLYVPWAAESPPLRTTVLASPGVIEVHVSSSGAPPAVLEARLESAVAALAAPLGEDVVSTDGASLEQAVGVALTARGWRIGLAESCTGGLATARLTDVAGSSAYVDAAVVAYSNAAKTAHLAVPAELIAAHGAVSEPVAVAMAAGIRARGGVEIGVAVTGIAGPGGGTETKPVGTVCIAVDGPGGVEVRTWRFTGDRAVIRALAASTALDRVRRYLRRLAGERPA